MLHRTAVDGQAQQIGPGVVAAHVHLELALVDQGEVELGDDLALSPSRIGEPRSWPDGETMAVKQPPEIGPAGAPVSAMIWACCARRSTARPG
ncbi:hypothetical protein [Kutzneria sp. NPDC051319]|uniref:hypothetical protein n=1 Tax=Kutzneria sp. NPDC051319 TaxID=3155047 RepID=UPI0034150B4F